MHVFQRHLRRIIGRGLSRRLYFLLSRAHSILCLSLLTVAVGYAVVTHGGDGLFDASLSLLVLGLAAVVGAGRASGGVESVDAILVAAALLPAYVALQLVPLPLAGLRVAFPPPPAT